MVKPTGHSARLGIGSIHGKIISHLVLCSVGGTSASAPTFAGIVTLLNNIRLGNNKPALGFLNPFLYQVTILISVFVS